MARPRPWGRISRFLIAAVAFGSIGAISLASDVDGSDSPVTPYGQVDYQALGWQTEDVATTSTTFEEVSGLSYVEACDPTLAASATVSMTLSGAAAEVRVALVNGRGKRLGTLAPGVTTFDPGAAPTQSFSYVFVQPPFRWPRHAFFSAQWRSPTGGEVTMTSGSLRILYDRDQDSGC
jgi:hypothetical protein